MTKIKAIVAWFKRAITFTNKGMIKILEAQGYKVTKNTVVKDHSKSLKGKKIK